MTRPCCAVLSARMNARMARDKLRRKQDQENKENVGFYYFFSTINGCLWVAEPSPTLEESSNTPTITKTEEVHQKDS